VSEDPDPADLAPAILTPEEGEMIPPEIRPKVESLEVLVREHRFEMIRSPLLPPDLLQRYDNVVPGLSAKLVKWTEDETKHRRSLELTHSMPPASFGFEGRLSDSLRRSSACWLPAASLP
jgi:hypothetical protein